MTTAFKCRPIWRASVLRCKSAPRAILPRKTSTARIVDHYPLTPDALLALKLGRADAAVVDELVALEEARANPGEVKVVGTPFTIEYYGIAMRKGGDDLLRDINRALAQMKADGTYDEIYDRWFGAN